MPLKRTIVNKGKWVLGSNLARSVTRFFSVMVLARLLTPEDYGIYASAYIVLGLANNVTEMGVGQALIHRTELEPAHVSTGYTLSLGFGLVLAALLYAAAGPLAGFLGVDEAAGVIRLFALIVPLKAYTIVSEGLLRRDLRMKRLAFINYSSFVVGSVAVTIVLAVLDFAHWALAIGYLAVHVTGSLLLLVSSQYPLRLGFSAAHARDLLSTGVGYTASRLLHYIAVRGDYFVASRWLGAAPLGIYNRAYRLMDMSNVVLGRTFDSVLFPAFARYRDDPEELRSAYRRGTTICAALFLPLSVSFSLLAPELILAVLGPRWTAVAPVLQILAFAVYFRLGYKFYTAINYAFGRVYLTTIYQVIYATTVIGGGYLAATRFGIHGVAVVVLGAIGLQYILQAATALFVLAESVTTFVRLQLGGVVLALANLFLSIELLSLIRGPVGTLGVIGIYAVYLVVFWALALSLPKSVIGEDLARAGRLAKQKLGWGAG